MTEIPGGGGGVVLGVLGRGVPPLSPSPDRLRQKRCKNHTLWDGTYLVGLYKGDYSLGENPCILKILSTGLGAFKCFIWSRHFEKERIGLKG